MSQFDVRTSFVSFVDHLPSDIVRKLWLIQSLNIAHETHRNELETLLKQLKSLKGSHKYQPAVHRITMLSAQLTQLRREALAESKSIATTIKLAKMQLASQHEQLEHDHKMNQNEIEMNETLRRHAQRTNKRITNPIPSQPKTTLKLNIDKLTQQLNTPIKRHRGRPRKGESEAIRMEKQKKLQELKRLRLLMVEEEVRAAARAAVDSSFMKETKTRKSRKAAGERKPTKAITHEIHATAEVTQLDPNEEVFCLCRQGSFGQMVGCDNDECPYEWFHYACVGLRRAPKGAWICPVCTEAKAKEAEKSK